jgi:hypothetical protein
LRMLTTQPSRDEPMGRLACMGCVLTALAAAEDAALTPHDLRYR